MVGGREFRLSTEDVLRGAAAFEPGLRTAASRAWPASRVRVILAEQGRRTPRACFRRRQLESEGYRAQQAGQCIQTVFTFLVVCVLCNRPVMVLHTWMTCS